jgi:predicted DNA-binding transcriptional regulator YafY
VLDDRFDNPDSSAIARAATAVTIIYTNYRDETAPRTVIPDNFWFGETEWHRGAQWFMDAYDVERHVIRSFALADVKSWSSVSEADAISAMVAGQPA